MMAVGAWLRGRRGPSGSEDEQSSRLGRLVEEHLRPRLRSRRLSPEPPVVLVQMHRSPKFHVAAAILATVLAVTHQAEIVAYRFAEPRDLGSSVRRRRSERAAPLMRAFSMFADQVTVVKVTRRDVREAAELVTSYAASVPTTDDLAAVSVRGVNIGETVIDKIVQKGHVWVDPLAPDLLAMLRELAAEAIALDRFVALRHVAAMVAIDVAYAPGISLRLAITHGIPAYIAHHKQFVHLTPDLPFSGLASHEYRGVLSTLSDDERQRLREGAAALLEQRLGATGTGFTGTQSRVWEHGDHPFLTQLDRAGRPVGLVVSHSFYDAQHAGGPFLFSDFHAWFEHLRSIAPRTNTIWLVKLHPDSRDGAIGVRSALEGLFANSPNVLILPMEVTQRQLLDFGVDLVYSIYGTAAFEFPYLGVPAVTCRPRSVHSPFGHALVPTTREELEDVLLDPARWEHRPDATEMLDYAALHYLAVKRSSIVYFLNSEEVLSHRLVPFDEDWPSMMSEESFAAAFEEFSEWVASGTHSANFWFGLQRMLRALREDATPLQLVEPDAW